MARKPSKDFETALNGFIHTGTAHREYALECSIFAIQHFAEHGDVVYLNRFAEAMTQTKTMRRNALMKWACDFAPLKFEGGKFVGDTKKGKPKDTDIEGALAKPFWEHAPEEMIQNYNGDDVVKMVNQLVKRLKGERAKLNPEAKQKVTLLEHVFDKAANAA